MHNQVKLEQEILAFWKENKIYEKTKQKCSTGTPFYFCDGPPYATGQIHPGTAWNKCIKDAFCRFKRATGYNVRAQPGYDTHGLPIEVKVEQELKIKNKQEIEKLGVDNFVKKCKEFASTYIGIISNQFIRCGVWMDFDNPYITFKDEYIDASWKTIKAAEEKGLLYEGVYVVPYCSRCETTLANYELEYQEQTDPSIYVKFPIEGTENQYFIIWTTTPWTLVSNMAIMAHPLYDYVKVKVGEEIWFLAKERLEHLLNLIGESATVLEQMSGKKLENKKYIHPLQKKIGKNYERRVVLSDEFVSLEEGTGLVHCAPGHGPEDFLVGKRMGIEIYSPVDENGKFTKEAGEYKGLHVREASKKVIEDLKEENVLVYESKITHRYPRCWRCKTPLIFIATNQWFIAITKVKEKMLSEIENCEWHPDFAKTRFREFVSSAPDWCISRQRYWGIPLPIWKCQKCGNLKVIGCAKEIPKISELHRPYIDEIVFQCEKCKGKMQRIPDILDVWFDSGNAVWASLSPEEQKQFQYTDFILEGKDQTRGWFYSLLGSGVVLNNKIPYKAVLMHGFFVDEKGEKMSKSLGNFVPFEEIVDKYGADTFRIWALKNAVWDDLRFNWNEIKEAHRTISTIYNLGQFLLRFYSDQTIPFEKIDKNKLRIEDRWLLSRLEKTIEECTEGFEKYEIHLAVKSLYGFLLEDVSRFYMKLLKKNLDEDPNSPSLAVLYKSIFESLKLLTPIAPFISESIYQTFYRKYEKKESISLFDWPKVEPQYKDIILEKQFEIAKKVISALSACRQKAKIPLRWPLEEAIVKTQSTEINSAVKDLSEIICLLSNVNTIKTDKDIKTKISIVINQSKVGEAFKQETPAVMEALKKLEPEEVASWFSSEKSEIELEGFKIKKDMINLIEDAPDYSIVYFEGGKAILKTKINEKLYEKAMIREISRRIQMMRKEMKLVETDKIFVGLEIKDSELLNIAKKNSDEISKQVNAEKIEFKNLHAGLSKEWEIEDSKIVISIEKK